MPDDCLVCREQRGDVELPGGPLWETPRRHVPGLDDLNDDEGAAIGVAAARLARALRETLDLERVYSMVVGHHVPHLHVHLFPRYRGTPSEVEWAAVDEWEGSPHGEAREIAVLVERLRTKMDA